MAPCDCALLSLLLTSAALRRAVQAEQFIRAVFLTPGYAVRVTLLSLRCTLSDRTAALSARMDVLRRASVHVIGSTRLRRVIDVVLTLHGDDAVGVIGATQALDVRAAPCPARSAHTHCWPCANR